MVTNTNTRIVADNTTIYDMMKNDYSIIIRLKQTGSGTSAYADGVDIISDFRNSWNVDSPFRLSISRENLGWVLSYATPFGKDYRTDFDFFADFHTIVLTMSNTEASLYIDNVLINTEQGSFGNINYSLGGSNFRIGGPVERHTFVGLLDYYVVVPYNYINYIRGE